MAERSGRSNDKIVTSTPRKRRPSAPGGASAAKAGGDAPGGATATEASATSARPPRKAVKKTVRPAPDPALAAQHPAGRPTRAAMRARADRPLRVVHPDERAEPDVSGILRRLPIPSDVESAVGTLVQLLRAVGSAAGLSGDELESRVAQTLAFLRRRLTGDYEIDEFGFDRDFTEEIWLPLLRPLYKHWFRVEVRGVENLPDDGSALVVANHSGTLPLDGLMTQLAIHDAHPAHRFVRMLGADLVFRSPFVGELSRKSGTTLAANPDAERLLSSGELVAVWPEGFKGIGKPFSDRYRLQRFGRGGFVSAAVRTGAPIIPCSIVGAEEIYPMLGNAKSLARIFGFPYFPVTLTFPWLGIFGLIPLPSKWIIEFGAPIQTEPLGAAAADDPMVLFEVTDQVRETIQQTLYSLLLQRRSVFY